MPERPDLRKIATDIREALDSYPREALAEILTYVFQAYVVEGVPTVHAVQTERIPELEGLAFPELIQALQMRLDVPELSLFEVAGGRVSLRLAGEVLQVAMGAEARRAASAPLPTGQAATPPPPAAPGAPGASSTEGRIGAPPRPAPAAEAPRPTRGLSVNPGGGRPAAQVSPQSAAPPQPAAPGRPGSASTQPAEDPGDDDAASKRFKLLEID